MTRKILAIFMAAAIMLQGAGCTQKEEDGTAEAIIPAGEISAERVNAGLSTDNGGYYDLFVDITVGFGENGEIEYAYLSNPVLLAFKVSEDWPGGVYIYSGEEMCGILESLRRVAEEADAETREQLLSILEQLENGGPIEGAST